ncbi:MAG: hypothetical protein ACKVX7_15600 [Planctomycetota bacterium]
MFCQSRLGRAALVFALLIPLQVFAYKAPKIKAGTRPAGAPADSTYFDVEVTGVDSNNPISRVYVEIDENIPDANVTGNGAGGIPDGWTKSIATVGTKKFLCFSRADNSEGNVTFKICIAAVGDKKGKLGNGEYIIYKLVGTDHTKQTSGTSQNCKILLCAVAPHDVSGMLSTISLLPPGLTAVNVFLPSTAPVSDLQVEIELVQLSLSGLAIDLIAPNGDTTRLHDHGGASGENQLWSSYSAIGEPNSPPFMRSGRDLQPSGPGSLFELTGLPVGGNWTLMFQNDSPELGWLGRVELRNSAFPAPRPIRNLSCAVTPIDPTTGVVQLNWALGPGQMLALIQVRIDGELVAVMPGLETSYVSPPLSGVHEFTVESHTPAGKLDEARCRVAVADALVVCDLESGDGLIASAATLAGAFANLAEPVAVVSRLDPSVFASQPRAVFVCAGTYPDNYVLSFGDGALLAALADAGTPIYCEGADIWGFDPATPFAAVDGVADFGVGDGDDSFVAMIGANHGPLHLLGYAASYSQDQFGNDYTDRLLPDPLQPAGSVWLNGGLGSYTTGVFLDIPSAPVLCQSWEFGGYGGDKNALAAAYLSGFFGPGSEPFFQRGDANADGGFNIGDVIYALSSLFSGGPLATCLDAVDANDDGNFNIGDPIHMLSGLFLGAVIPFPGPSTCGPDLTDDALDCASYSPCP